MNDIGMVFLIRAFCLLLSLPRRTLNSINNFFLSLLAGAKIDIDWRCAEVYNLERIEFRGRLHAGQGLWLHPILKTSKIIIGNNVSISNWTHIAALNEITISNNCLIGSKVHITDHYHGDTSNLITSIPPQARPLVSHGPVYIDENVWIGDGVVILPNVIIGRGAIIGANSVVNKNVEPYSVVAGVPAKKIRK